MVVMLGNRVKEGETIVRAAMQHLGGKLYPGTVAHRTSVRFPVDDLAPGRFIVEAETNTGRRVWAALEFFDGPRRRRR